MQTEPTRRIRPEILLNQRTASGLISFCSIASPPATSSVSIFPRSSRKVLSAVMRRPQLAISDRREEIRHDFDRIDWRRSGIRPAVHFRCAGEHLERSDQVQNLDAGARHEHDPARARFE